MAIQERHTSPKHLPALDGLRAIAIALVLLTHVWPYNAATPIANHLAAEGWVGVDLFFVLSGFLITRILLASLGRVDYYRRFYARRVRRILPAYYLLLAVVLLLLPLVSTSAALSADRRDWLWYVGLVSNVRIAQIGFQLGLLGISWSLSVEEQFYLVWPSVVKRCGRRGLAALAAALVVAVPVLRATLLTKHAISSSWLDLFTPFRMDSLAMGALMAALEAQVPRFSRASAVTLGALSVAVVALMARGTFGRESAVVVIAGHTMVALVAALLIQACLTPSSRVARVLEWRPMMSVGQVSYGLYLYHVLVLAIVSTVAKRAGIDIGRLTSSPLASGVAKCALVGLVAYGLARLSFRRFEEPIIRWRRMTGGAPAPNAPA